MLSRTLSRIPRKLCSISPVRSTSHYTRYNYNPLVECESQHTSRKHYSNVALSNDNKNAYQITDKALKNAVARFFAKLTPILALFVFFGIQDTKETRDEFV
jgi:hypothetical protein